MYLLPHKLKCKLTIISLKVPLVLCVLFNFIKLTPMLVIEFSVQLSSFG